MLWGSRKEMRVPTKQANPDERFYFWGQSPPNRLAKVPTPTHDQPRKNRHFHWHFGEGKKAGVKMALLGGWSCVAGRFGRRSECGAASSSGMFCGVHVEAFSRDMKPKPCLFVSTYALGASSRRISVSEGMRREHAPRNNHSSLGPKPRPLPVTERSGRGLGPRNL